MAEQKLTEESSNVIKPSKVERLLSILSERGRAGRINGLG